MYNNSKTKQNHNKILMVATQSFTYRCARSSGNTENFTHFAHIANLPDDRAHLYVKL